MSSYRICRITKPQPESTHEYLTHIAYYESAQQPQVILTIEEAIARIEKNAREFYVSTPQGPVFAVVERPLARRPFIRTAPGRTGRDLLLSLADC